MVSGFRFEAAPRFQVSGFRFDLRSRLLTLGKADANIVFLSLNRSLQVSSLTYGRASYAMAKLKQAWLCSFGLNGTFKFQFANR